MKGAKLSKPARDVLSEIREARSFTDFAEAEALNKKTLLRMYRRQYVAADLVRKAEAAIFRWQQKAAAIPQEILQESADSFEVSVTQLLTERQLDRYGNYSDAVLARYSAVFVMYKETRLSYRNIASEVGYKNHFSVINNIKIISDLMDTRPALRRKILDLQNSISTRQQRIGQQHRTNASSPSDNFDSIREPQ